VDGKPRGLLELKSAECNDVLVAVSTQNANDGDTDYSGSEMLELKVSRAANRKSTQALAPGRA